MKTTLTLVQTEASLQSKVVELARLYNWAVYHTWNSRNSAKGFPDLCLARPLVDGTAQLMFMELKTETGKVSAEQTFWIELLNAVPGVSAAVFRPSNWDRIEKLLRGKS